MTGPWRWGMAGAGLAAATEPVDGDGAAIVSSEPAREALARWPCPLQVSQQQAWPDYFDAERLLQRN